jgi:hypothetical protein
VSAALKRARRRNIPDKATAILAALRGEHLGQQPAAVTAAYAVTVRALIAVIAALNEQVKTLQGQVEDGCHGGLGPHGPAAAPSCRLIGRRQLPSCLGGRPMVPGRRGGTDSCITRSERSLPSSRCPSPHQGSAVPPPPADLVMT